MPRKTPRIEPTLFGDGEPQEPILSEEHFRSNSSSKELVKRFEQSLAGYYQLVRKHALANRKRAWIVGGVVVAISLVVTILSAGLATPSEETGPLLKPEPEVIKAPSRFHQVSFPDKFSLWTTEYNGMVVNWLSDESTETKIWDLASAEGDQSCENIRFNNGDSYRALDVLVEQGSNYFASFSPLDTVAIVNNIAMRGSFELCGYQFSLKGSQSILSQHPHYSDLLNH